MVLANILRTDAHAHRALPADTQLARAVAVLARAAQDSVWRRTKALQEQIVDAGSAARILMLTAFDLDEYVYTVLQGWGERIPAQGRASGRSSADDCARSPPEREAIGEVARAWSNREIAQRLMIFAATVKSDVGRILIRLALRHQFHIVVLA